MSDKEKKKNHGHGDKTDDSKKDGKRHKLKFGQKLRSSLAWASCVTGKKSPNGEMEEDKDFVTTRPGHSLRRHRIPSDADKESLPLMEKLHNLSHHDHPGLGEYGTTNNDDRIRHHKEDSSDSVTIDLYDNKDDPFPDEKNKTIVALLVLGLCFVLNTVSLVLTHERMQKRDPLPDIFLDTVGTLDQGLYVGEVFIMISTFFTFGLLMLHRYRWIVFRRYFTILSLLYLMRAITMYVTVMPVASYTYHCDPKMNSSSFGEGAIRVLKLVSGFGLSINGKHVYCGDYIFSGHAVILIISFLIIQEYSPRSSWHWHILHWTQWLISFSGIILVMVARGHYTVDVLIAYYVTTRTFWIYHTLSNRPELKNLSEGNFLIRVWWFRYFHWLEKNVNGLVPRQYSIPFSSKFIDFEGDDNSSSS